MKLDKSVIEKIYELANDSAFGDEDGAYIPRDYFTECLEKLDLKFKSGDSSQATLVEND